MLRVTFFIIGFLATVATSVEKKLLDGASSYEEALIFHANELGLAQTRQWEKLLFYTPTWLMGRKSFVDADGFFLSPDGKSDAKAELAATLRAFFKPLEGDFEKHPQCLYPARFSWLNEKLKFDTSKLRPVHCPRMEALLRRLDPEKMSLVFSSSYLNSPASMFGHTFLRVHKRGNDLSQAALLDNVISYAAHPDSFFPGYYMLMGLTGGFPGLFSLSPYYLKVQEYNNAESRDLWEYELSLTREQVLLVIRTLFEVGPHRINYYYFDDNCAYILLALLEAGNPDLVLTEKFPAWVTPPETVRVVAEADGLVRKVNYRPSNYSRYIARLKELPPSHQMILTEILEEEKSSQWTLESLRKEGHLDRTKILDTALEYIDFKEKLSGSALPVRYATLQPILLSMRAVTGHPSSPITMRDDTKRPEFGHGPVRVAVGLGNATDRSFYNAIEFRPALHDLLGSPLGYSEELQIKFFDLSLGVNWVDRSLELDRLHVIEVLSLPPISLLLKPVSWRVTLGLNRLLECSGLSGRCTKKYLQGGAGWTFQPFRGLSLFALGLVETGWTSEEGQGIYAGPALNVGLITSLFEGLRFQSNLVTVQRIGGTSVRNISFENEVSLPLSRMAESRAKLTLSNGGFETLFTLAGYF